MTPTCDICGITDEGTNWCGECGNCREHCAEYEDCAPKTNYDDKGPINLVCPRCGEMIPSNENPGAYPGALTRWGGRQIEVCSACGQNEAIIQFLTAKDGGDAMEAVHPTRGEVLWKTLPDGVL